MKRFLIPALFAIGLLPAGLAAQTAQDGAVEDPRWFPYLGCWEPAGPELAALVCVTPEGAGVRVEVVEDGGVTQRFHWVADGLPYPVEEGGCIGTRRAEWSADGRRIFTDETLRCGPEATRSARGVLALGSGGSDWIDLQEVTAPGVPSFLSVRRFRPALPGTLAYFEREDVAPAGALAVQTARAHAARPLGEGEVLEGVRRAGSSVAGALVAEIAAPFTLDASALRRLRGQGIPPEVLDLMIAVTWPDRFQIRGSDVARSERASSDASPAWSETAPAAQHATRPARGGYGVWGPSWSPIYGSYYDPFYGSYYDPFYGYYFGSGYRSGYGGWGAPSGWYAGRPLIVVVGGGAAPAPRGSVSPEGYTRPGGTPASGSGPPVSTANENSPGARPTATPPATTSGQTPARATPPAAAPTVPRPPTPTISPTTGASSGSSTGSSTAGSSTSGTTGTTAPPPPPVRPAIPRTQGGGGGG
jgi:hypothetical protein